MPHRVTRREFIGTAVATTAIVGTSRIASPAPAKRPNVLLILADDRGYGDLSCYGRPDYRTPVLDAFAKQGIKFISAYGAAPVCTGQRGAYDRTLFWRTVERDAARVGNWKYLQDRGDEYLFDLAADPGEKADLRRKQAGTFEQIKKQYLAWNAQMLPKPDAS